MSVCLSVSVCLYVHGCVRLCICLRVSVVCVCVLHSEGLRPVGREKGRSRTPWLWAPTELRAPWLGIKRIISRRSDNICYSQSGSDSSHFSIFMRTL